MDGLTFDDPEHDKFDGNQIRALAMLTRLTGKGAIKALNAAKREVKSDLFALEGKLRRIQYKIDSCSDSGVSMSYVDIVGGLRANIRNRKKTFDGIETALFGLVHGSREPAKDMLAAINGLPGVITTGCNDGHFSVLLAARCTYRSVTYDLGDWLLVIEDPSSREKQRNGNFFETIELRSAVREDWRRNSQFAYPYYGFGGVGFCYGENDGLISDHIRYGNIYQAVVVALALVSAVNDNDITDLPNAFLPV